MIVWRMCLFDKHREEEIGKFIKERSKVQNKIFKSKHSAQCQSTWFMEVEISNILDILSTNTSPIIID